MEAASTFATAVWSVVSRGGAALEVAATPASRHSRAQWKDALNRATSCVAFERSPLSGAAEDLMVPMVCESRALAKGILLVLPGVVQSKGRDGNAASRSGQDACRGAQSHNLFHLLGQKP